MKSETAKSETIFWLLEPETLLFHEKFGSIRAIFECFRKRNEYFFKTFKCPVHVRMI